MQLPQPCPNANTISNHFLFALWSFENNSANRNRNRNNRLNNNKWWKWWWLSTTMDNAIDWPYPIMLVKIHLRGFSSFSNNGMQKKTEDKYVRNSRVLLPGGESEKHSQNMFLGVSWEQWVDSSVLVPVVSLQCCPGRFRVEPHAAYTLYCCTVRIGVRISLSPKLGCLVEHLSGAHDCRYEKRKGLRGCIMQCCGEQTNRYTCRFCT